jgi:tetraprenyl-beta-curcumene synthase
LQCGYARLRLAQRSGGDATPLCAAQITALARATIRQLVWGLRGVSRSVTVWRARAAGIPEEPLRNDALAALTRKRANIDGAALFWTIPGRRNRDLLRLLVTYEIMADYLDCASERAAHVGVHNGAQLHRAMIEALDPDLELSDYYLFSPWKDDSGYLRALVECCRECCRRLPSYQVTRPLTIRAAQLAQVLPLNHEPDAAHRNRYLTKWALREFPDKDELTWFEYTGAASAWLTILALLALAAEPGCEPMRASAIYSAYLPWVSLTGTMLDSYSDIAEDTANAAHSYLSHYESPERAFARTGELLHRSAAAARRLPDGCRHAVIVACMAAMYLSKDSTRAGRQRTHTQAIARSGGSLTRLLMPVLRLWRLLYGQRSV